MNSSPMLELIKLIVRNDLAEKLIAEHQCVARGRCACSTPNVPRSWPCTTYAAALQASSLPQAGLRAVG